MKKIQEVEGLRGLAAIYVFAGHTTFANLTQAPKWTEALLFGQEAVMMFFLLSGFVIMTAMERSEDKSFSNYISRRALRIFPIYFLALFISWAFSQAPDLDVYSLMGNALMLQDFSGGKPGVLFGTFGGNTALWSLSYEWWFYVMFFPVFTYVDEKLQAWLVTAAALIALAIYNRVNFQPLLFIAYFPLWWVGAEIARSVRRNQPLPLPVIALAATVACWFALPVLIAWENGAPLSYGLHPVLEARHAMACLLLVGAFLVASRMNVARFGWLLKPFAIIAPISYGLYATHFPIVSAHLFPGAILPLRLALYGLIALAVAWFAEVPFQRMVVRLVRMCHRSHPIVDSAPLKVGPTAG